MAISTAERESVSAHEEERHEGVQDKKKPFGQATRTLIFSFLGVLVFGVTLFFTGLTVQGAVFDRYMFFVILSLCVFVFWVVGGVSAGKLELRRTPIDIPLLVFLGVYGIALVFSKDIWHSFAGSFTDPSRGFIVVTAAVLLYFVVVSTQTTRSLSRLTGLFVSGLGVFAVWSAIALSGIFQGKSGILAFLGAVPIDDFFSLNILLTVTLPIVVAFVLRIASDTTTKARVPKMIAGFFVIAAYLYGIGALFLSVTLLALFVGMGIFISYISGDIVRVAKQWIWLPLALFLVVPILFFLGQGVVAKNGLQLPQSVLPGVGISWEVLTNTMKQRFLSGTGPATYGYAFSHFFPTSLNATSEFSKRLSYPPNFFFETVVTAGILGGVVFLVLLGFALSVAIYLLTQRRGASSVLSLGFWVSFLVLVIVGFFYGISGSVVFPALLLSILGMALLLSESGVQPRYVTFSLRAAPQYALASTLLLLVACIGALALFATLGKMYAADIYAGRAVQEQAGDVKAGIANADKAIGLNGHEGQYFILRGQMFYKLATEALSKVNQDDKSDKNSESIQQAQLLAGEAIRNLAQGRNLLPGNIFAQEALAQTLESLGYMQDAYDAYDGAVSIEPKNPMYPVNKARIRIMQAEGKEGKEKDDMYAEADRFIGEALVLKANYGEAWYQKALLLEGKKDLDGSVDTAKKALEATRDTRTGFLLARLYQERNKDGDAKNAEGILNAILGVNDKEVNAQLSLAGLYERTGRTKEAIERYTKVRDLLPKESNKAREQLSTIIDDLKNGKSTQQVEAQNQNPDQSVQPLGQ